jgi:beta-mannanase
VRFPAFLIAAVFAASFPAAGKADPYLPPQGKTFAGVAGGYEAASFERTTGSHPAVFQFFGGWNQTTRYMFSGASTANARLMIHLSTMRGTTEQITPRGIATGHGDTYLRKLNARIAEYGGVTYIRLMSEMDGNWNAYCAYTASGRSKGPAYSTSMFRQAWRRTVIVIRGGPIDQVNAQLRSLHMPPVDTGGRDLARPRVSFLWVPQVAGAPDTRANSPPAYWPGGRYVDWVGTDFYSKFPNWGGLERFYGDRKWASKPFAFGEWAVWGRDDPSFVHRLFAWSRSHRRVRMLLYNQGKLANGPFRLAHYPRSRRALAAELRAPRFAIPPGG